MLDDMIRKQVYITAAHDAELKVRAGAALTTEADVVREALDVAFGFVASQTAEQAQVLSDFIRTAQEFRATNRPPRRKGFYRASVYQRFATRPTFREGRWIP